MKKTNKKLIAIAAGLAVFTASFGLAACNGLTGGHEHTYSTGWTKNETQHWHAATCEHTDEKSDLANHSYVDGVCVCGAEDPDYEAPAPHEHTYATEWTKNETQHWHAATCEHEEEKSDLANHNYVDGVCVCGAADPDYEAPVPHEHTYATEWSKDETQHWHAATCEHTDEKSDLANHTYVDGVCVCGAEDPDAEPEPVQNVVVALGVDKTLESLDETGIAVELDGCEEGKTYQLSSENGKVRFYAGIEQGNPVVFEYNPRLVSVNVVSTDGTLSNVVLKLTEYEEEEVEYPEITLNQEITVRGADFFTPSTYKITLEAGSYQVIINGEATDLSSIDIVCIGDEFDESGEFVNPIEPIVIDPTAVRVEAGIYYVQVFDNVTFKVAATPEHVHTIDESVWESGPDGHWHPLTCIHGLTETDTVYDHNYLGWSQADEDGVQTRTCVDCGYKEMQVTGTAITGGRATSNAVKLSEDGVYVVTIKAVKDAQAPGEYYYAAEQYFSLGGTNPQMYTVKLLTSNSTIAPEVTGVDSFSNAGDSYSVFVDANRSSVFSIVSNDSGVDKNYTFTVAFKVTVSAPPAEGDILRPITVQVGENGKEDVTSGEKAYYAIPAGSFGSSIKITFGDGVTVTALGVKITNDGTPVESGAMIDEKNYKYGAYYLCVTGGNGKFNVEKVYAAGTKGNPVVGKYGEDNTNSVALNLSTTEQWFKITIPVDNKFTISADTTGANFEVYNSLDDASPAFSGSEITMDFTAGVPVYIRATHNNHYSYSFTVTPAKEDDRGGSESNAIIITEAGEYTVPEKYIGQGNYDVAVYYEYTAAADGTVTVTYDGGAYDVFVCVNGSFSTAFQNPTTFSVTAGETYKLTIYVNANINKFTVEIA